MNRIPLALFSLALFTPVAAHSAEPAFVAASIKSDNRTAFRNPKYGLVEFKPGGRFTATTATLFVLVKAAYGITNNDRIAKGPNCPDWVLSERFRVEAVAEEGTIPDNLDSAQVRKRMEPLLQRLLAERFHLVIRRVTKEMPVYELAAAKSGPKLVNSPVSEEACRTSYECHQLLGDRLRGLNGTAVTMEDLASALERSSDRPIIDKTGIEGLYVFNVPPFADMRPPVDDVPDSWPAELRPPPEPPKPSLNSILEKNFGLQLVRTRALIETIRIESVEKPSPD